MWNKLKRQIYFWKLAGWTAPFVAMISLTISYYIDDNTTGWVTCAIITGFISISIFWWWWTLDLIKTVFSYIKNTEENFQDIKKEIGKTKELLYEDVSYRKRREQKKD